MLGVSTLASCYLQIFVYRGIVVGFFTYIYLFSFRLKCIIVYSLIILNSLHNVWRMSLYVHIILFSPVNLYSNSFLSFSNISPVLLLNYNAILNCINIKNWNWKTLNKQYSSVKFFRCDISDAKGNHGSRRPVHPGFTSSLTMRNGNGIWMKHQCRIK